MCPDECWTKIAQPEWPRASVVSQVVIPDRSDDTQPGVGKRVEIDSRPVEQANLRFGGALVDVGRSNETKKLSHNLQSRTVTARNCLTPIALNRPPQLFKSTPLFAR